jgi:chitinase
LKEDVFIEDAKLIPLSVKQMAWLKEEGFGGIMIWSVDMDDFRGQCGTGKYPLINAMRQELEGYTVKLEYDGPYEGSAGGGAYTTKDRK